MKQQRLQEHPVHASVPAVRCSSPGARGALQGLKVEPQTLLDVSGAVPEAVTQALLQACRKPTFSSVQAVITDAIADGWGVSRPLASCCCCFVLHSAEGTVFMLSSAALLWSPHLLMQAERSFAARGLQTRSNLCSHSTQRVSA